MSKKYHFIAGLPRSGSTLLVSILNQNPNFFAEISNPLYDVLDRVSTLLHDKKLDIFRINENKISKIVQSFIDSFYYDVNKNTIFNTNRGWVNYLNVLDHTHPDSKIICCVRDIVGIMNSFEYLYQTRGLSQPLFVSNDIKYKFQPERIDLYAKESIGRAYEAFKEAYYGAYRKKLFIVEYDNLIADPKKMMKEIYNFLGEEYYDHDFNNVEANHEIYDKAIGVRNMHYVRKTINKNEIPLILPPEVVHEFSNREFWRA